MSSDEEKDTEVSLKSKTSAKRKRDSKAVEEEELEIDVNAPEPPSKRAKRKEKKSRKDSSSKKERSAVEATTGAEDVTTAVKSEPATAQKTNERSDYGVWIGNLSFTTTKDDVRGFLRDQGEIAETQITRTYMPAPSDGKSKNKGFAYVDFATVDVLEKALALSEKLLGGRKLLIKNAKSFEGRPEKPKIKDEAKTEKEPTKRIFVGNLSFDVTRDDIAEHFGQAGEVEDVFLATFEDSGKCKGFGWVRFKEVEAAQAAVKGFVKVGESKGKDDSEEDDSEPEVVTGKEGKKKRAKVRKIFINRINGRPLRCEFAEDAQTRYKKRYGKDKDATHTGKPAGRGYRDDAPAIAEVNEDPARPDKAKPKRKGNADDRREDRRKRHDARTIAPGQTLANAPRASAAIVAGSGKKISFD